MRHGATEWNHTKRAQGQADIELNLDGHKQALQLALQLAPLDVTAVYSSDLKRASDTARPIAEAHGLEVVTDPDFREVDQGEWEGLTVDVIKERWPDLWGPARHYGTRPGGESPGQVRRRALEGLRRVVERHPGDVVVIVSHGGTIRWLSAEVLGYDDRTSSRLRGLGNGSAVSLDATIENGALKLSNLERLDGSTTDLDDPND